MLNRRWAIVLGLSVIEVWILGFMLRSVAGDRHVTNTAPAPAFASFGASGGGAVRTVETDTSPSVVIDADDVALDVTVRPGARVSIRERTQRNGWQCDKRRIDIERTSDGVRISARSGAETLDIGSLSRELDVVVPPQARLDVRNAGSTTVSGLRADAQFHTDDGNVSVSDHRGELAVTTGSGLIELRDVAGPSIETASGDGRVTFDRVRADRVTVKTDDGRIEIGRSLLHGGNIQTANGRVALGLDLQSDVVVSARASSGRVSAESPLFVTTAGEDADAPETIRVGAGSGRLDVGSADGSISIRAGEVERV